MRLLLFIVSTAILASTTAAQQRKAIVVITKGEVRGNVTFTQESEDSPVVISGVLENLSKGKHGFHVHEKGDLTSGCTSTGAHFNPHNKQHGSPKDENRHVGDLGNVEADDRGIASFQMTDTVISLWGANNILGRAIVVHSDADDLGLGGFSDSLTTGHAGSRIGCGVIGIVSPVNEVWVTSSTTSHYSVFSLVVLLATWTMTFF